MGQKVDPRGFRTWVNKLWPSEWFAKNKTQAADFFVEDVKIREKIKDYYYRSAIDRIVIRKTDENIELIIFTWKPAAVIGKKGAKVKEFKGMLEKYTGKDVKVIVKKVKVPELSAKIMAEDACEKLEKRMPYRRVGNKIIQSAMNKWVKWVKVQIAWRLGGADMCRTEKFMEGNVPLQTLRADIDYHYEPAKTKYGVLGVKVWIYKWKIYDEEKAYKKREKYSKKSNK